MTRTQVDLIQFNTAYGEHRLNMKEGAGDIVEPLVNERLTELEEKGCEIVNVSANFQSVNEKQGHVLVSILYKETLKEALKKAEKKTETLPEPTPEAQPKAEPKPEAPKKKEKTGGK